MRPRLRVLRHPELPGAPALAVARRPGRRGRGPGGRRGQGDRDRRPGPRLLRPGPLDAPGPPARVVRRRLRRRDRRAASRAVAAIVARTRLLYLYPSSLTDRLVDAILGDRRPLLRPLAPARVAAAAGPDAAVGGRRPVPGPDRADPRPRAHGHLPLVVHPRLPRRDRGGPRPAARVPGTRPSSTGPGSSLLSRGGDPRLRSAPTRSIAELALERMRECTELQDRITARRRDRLVGERRSVLVDAAGVGRTVHEAPEIDGVVRIPRRRRHWDDRRHDDRRVARASTSCVPVGPRLASRDTVR